MKTALDLIRRLREHQQWANVRLLDAAVRLTDEHLRREFPIGAGSVLATLAHLYAAEFVWLEALEGNPDPASPWSIEFHDLASLRRAWRELDERWASYILRLKEADLDKPIAKKSTSSRAGRTFTTPAVDILLHLPTHAAYTMAQAKNMLRHLGVTDLPDVMLISLSREGTMLSDA